MLTPSVNMVQSAFPEEQQGEISGLSRSISNLGSSFGTAIVGTVLALNLVGPADGYVLAMVPLIVVAIAGIVVAGFLPGRAPARPGGRGISGAGSVSSSRGDATRERDIGCRGRIDSSSAETPCHGCDGVRT